MILIKYVMFPKPFCSDNYNNKKQENYSFKKKQDSSLYLIYVFICCEQSK